MCILVVRKNYLKWKILLNSNIFLEISHKIPPFFPKICFLVEKLFMIIEEYIGYSVNLKENR